MGFSMDTTIAAVCANKRRVSALKSLGVVSVADALTYYPFRVTAPVPLRAAREARIGEAMAFAARVEAVRVVPMNARRGYRLEAVVDDSAFARERGIAGALARLVFFSYRKSYVDWMAARLRSGAEVVVAGEPSEFNGQLQFTHPEVLTVAAEGGDAATADEALARVSRPRPVYHASSRISSEHIHETILAVLNLLAGDSAPSDVSLSDTEVSKSTTNEASDMAFVSVGDTKVSKGDMNAGAGSVVGDGLSRSIPDILPEKVRADKGLLHRAEAFRAIHDPRDVKGFKAGIDTLRYEEAFVAQTALLRSRHDAHSSAAWSCAQGEAMRERFVASLPFALTDGQRSVIDDIAADMAQSHPMQRLLQGEVGSGKTVVALAAMLQAVGAGRQSVLVAPTQVLAEQHHETISRMVEAMNEEMDIPVILLTGGMKLAARRRAMATAASGAPCIIVATHAAFSKTFQAPNLALAVIDEQHRFGVEQRETLRTRGEMAPHLLVMTATPIPRTAAMTWFGDLDISWLTELPGGRQPITTVVVPEADGATMGRLFAHIRSRIDAGERAYVVCARIDDEDDASSHGSEGYLGIEMDPYAAGEDAEAARDGETRPPLHTVTQIAERLAALPQFAGVSFATLTGRDDAATKQRVMAEFAAGDTPVLVATTVIEVGVDVPQASCIVIFDADRYGLSQLHQLRGRVGRGGTKSWAFLVSRAEPGSPAEARLEVIHGTLDGAEIAQADLEFRGAGDVLGDAQSGGKSGLNLLRVVKDVDAIADARVRAGELLERDPNLTGSTELAGAVLDFTRGNETFLTSS